MAAKPVPRRRADGTIVYRQPFRLRPGGPVTYETFTTKREAERFGALVDRIGGQAARDARSASSKSAADVPTLTTALDRHLDALAASVTPGTIAEYRRMAARTWLPALGHLPVDSIDRPAITRWVTAQRRALTTRGTPYSPKSIANAHALLSAVLASEVDAGHVTKNAAKGMRLPSDAERAEMVILTEAEVARLLAALPDCWEPLVATLLGTGLRWGEATALTPGDLDLDADTPVLRVSRAWKKGDGGVYLGAPKTRKSIRTVSLPEWLVPLLRVSSQGKPGDALLFTGAQGGRVSAQHFHARVWRPAIERAGIGKRPRIHDCRHTHASLMIADGMDMLTLQRRLGHESYKTTGDTYSHLVPDSHARAAHHATRILAGAFPQIES